MAPPSTHAMTEARSGTSAALSEQEILDRARDLAARLASLAAPGDPPGARLEADRACLRDSGLLALSVPVAFGGIGARWPTTYRVIRILAAEGGALAHAFAAHHLQLAAITLCGSALQQRRLLTATVAEQWVWGETVDSPDEQVAASIHPNGFILDGAGGLSSNWGGADWLMASAWDCATQCTVSGALAGTEAGLSLQPDDGTVHLCSVLLEHDQVLQRPGQVVTARASLRALVSQLAMANLELGTAQRAFHAAVSRDCIERGLQAGARQALASKEPGLQERYGKMNRLLHSAAVVADHAAAELERVLRKGVLVTAQERGELAVAVTEAECLAQRAGVDVIKSLAEPGCPVIKTSHQSTPAN